jgi:hypothetical protein
MKHLIGFFIRRSIRDADAVRGKTMVAYGHTLYNTREKASRALDQERAYGLDSRFTYDVCEAWMHTGDDDQTRTT